MHLADAFIQSDLQYIHFLSVLFANNLFIYFIFVNIYLFVFYLIIYIYAFSRRFYSK